MDVLFESVNLGVVFLKTRRRKGARAAEFRNAAGRFEITDMNRTAVMLLGCRKEKAVGLSPEAVFPEALSRQLLVDLSKGWTAGRILRSRRSKAFRYTIMKLDSDALACLFTSGGRDREQRPAISDDAMFSAVSDILDEMVWLVDMKSRRILYINRAYEKIFGRPRGEVFEDALAWTKYVHPRDAEAVRGKIFKTNGSRIDFSFRALQPDSTVKWVHARSFPVLGENGETIRLIGIAEDITERVRITEELAASEKRFRGLFAESPASLWELDLSGLKVKLDTLGMSGVRDLARHLRTNPEDLEEALSLIRVMDVSRETLKLFRAASRDMVIIDPRAALTEESSRAFIEALAALHGGQALAESVSRWRTYTGEEMDLVMRLTVASGSESSWREVLLSFTDITDLKRKERELLESEERFRIISEQSQIGLCIVQEGRIAYANKTFTSFTGFSDGTGMSNGEKKEGRLFPGEEMYKVMQRMIAEGSQEAFRMADVPLTTILGERKWFNIFMKLIPIGGKPAGMAALIDITEEKRAREQARERQAQLIQADKLASIGVLAAGVAHEINNPNQAIILSSQVLKDAWSEVTQILDGYQATNGDFSLAGVSYSQMKEMLSNCISAIRDCSTKIETIVSDLKGFARQDVSETFRPLDLNMAVKSSLTLLSNMLKKSTRKLSVDLAAHLPPVMGNYQKLEQVFINLIQNACQALPDPSKGISISTFFEEEPSRVVFQVADEGTGIMPEDMPHINDPFFTTKRETGGTGLGLSICATIVEQHAGSMEHVSTPGAGTRAIIRLPAV